MNFRNLALVILSVLTAPTAGDSAWQVPDSAFAPSPLPTPAALTTHMRKLPLRFEANAGQWDPRVRFVARQGGGTLFITDEGMTLGLRDVKATPHRAGMSREKERTARPKALAEANTTAISMKLVGASPSAPRGENELITKSNFFLGNDRTKWRTNVPNYGQVRAKEWVPGVDVVWHGRDSGRDSGLEYDLEVAAGVDARGLAFEFEGADRIDVAHDGSLEITTRAGVLVQQPPRVMQAGRELPTRYVVRGAKRVAFAVDGYDTARALLIDPVLAYSTYLDGAYGEGVAIDTAGNAYVTGQAPPVPPWTFHTVNPYQAAYGGGNSDAFITKLDANGNALVYSTYLGGSGDDVGLGITVDATGNAYVTGATTSTNFPTAGPKQATYGGGANDVFVTKLNAAGSLLTYSTYLGGSGDDVGSGITVDGSGSAYVTGKTNSTNFPTASPYQSVPGGGYDAFVSKLSVAGSALTYSTYLGGGGDENGLGIAVDGSTSACVTGYTASTNFPTVSAYQQAKGGGSSDVFVTKLNATGAALAYSTYLGGSGNEAGSGIAVDTSGGAYVAGSTTSSNFPTASAYQTTFGGGTTDGFVTKLSAAGSALAYSTYLGGADIEYARGIAVDAAGSAYVTGLTASTNFPTARPYQATNGAGQDAFVTKLSASGSALTYSTYLGGSGDDDGYGVAVDGSGNAYVAGRTSSPDFPTVNAYQGSGSGDVFLAKTADPALTAGTPCTGDGVCASGHCADTVCCDSACTDQCEACDVQGHVGTCTPVTGAPHGSRAACQTNGACAASCDGTNTKTCSYLPTVCASTCSNAAETDSLCDNTGACVVQAPHSCNNLVCADTTKCKTSCSSNSDCVNGLNCNNGACVSGGVCTDDHTSKGANGVSTDCTPYKCDVTGTGSCKSSCSSVDDCVSPNVCDPSGKCVPPPTSGSSGCSCNTEPENAAPWLLVLLTMAGATVIRQRVRRERR